MCKFSTRYVVVECVIFFSWLQADTDHKLYDTAGNGMKQRQVQAVEDRIRLQLFPALQQEIGDSLSRLIDSTFSDLQEQLRPVFGVVQHGFGVWLEGPVRLQQANLYDASFVAQVQQLLRNRENIARKIDATRTTTTQGVVTSSPAS